MDWIWEDEHEKAFIEINNEVRRVVETAHFKRNNETRIICKASNQGLGAVLQQKQQDGEWRPMCFASRFLTDFYMVYFNNELELLAIVWAIENFKYVYGVQFKVESDHRALMSVFKLKRGNNTFSSRLSRWVDRLLSFDFEVVHVAGRTLSMAKYLSRQPSNLEGASKKAENASGMNLNLWMNGTVFVRDEFAKFCKQLGIKHKTCPVRDHRGNEKNRKIDPYDKRKTARKQANSGNES